MMTPEQAREILDTIVRQVRLTRDEHSTVGQALELLYEGAKENQETVEETPRE